MAETLPKVETGKLPPDGGSRYNRLIFEKSPYLLQHAENPIDWYPWGDEAFARAARENRPVLLSIGYSTCHWCHVMARESFADQEVAEIINRYFVAIKVDREERPDIDAVYMRFCQALTGGGGWPLTVFLTPDRKPFYAGTYFPKESKYGRPGMVDVLLKIEDLWRTEKQKVLDSADRITGFVAGRMEENEKKGTPVSGIKLLAEGYSQLAASYDEKHGGFGKAPKFPTPHQLMFLLRYWKRTGEEKALEMVKHTLVSLRQGGIYDQLGFGFHRYSTDTRFLVPHFEKMLYDQALLVLVYLEAFQATGDKFFADTARETLTYVLRDMTADTGGFYSAEDADSEGEEGLFYLWREEEIETVLGREIGLRFNRKFQVKKEGNYPDESTREFNGKNILHLAGEDRKIDDLSVARALLYEKRLERVRPFRDDKIITSWNGLMLAAMARGGMILEEPVFVGAAERGADFILNNLVDTKGRLRRSYRETTPGFPAFLDDYAFLSYGLLDLYETTFRLQYLRKALWLTREAIALYWNREAGAFNYSGSANESLPLSAAREFYDGALPAGNSVALLNMLRLAQITDDQSLRETADTLAATISREAEEYPAGHTMFLSALDFQMGPSGEIVVAGKSGEKATSDILQMINKVFIPNKTVLLKSPDGDGAGLQKMAPYTEFQEMRNGLPTVYLCRNHSCKEPLVDLKTIAAELVQFPGE
ncbi:MAG: thioredoxin domain-containing protein [Proteobacteria bacterium]|nr:thioredoxin domain-containing protein [Pseudomonadota bacterium]MBU1737944.1 thioredoxin domain-containing protein [Pseudomonadota bacterium]